MNITKEMYLEAIDIVEQYLRQELQNIQVLKKNTLPTTVKIGTGVKFGVLYLSRRLENILIHSVFRCDHVDFISKDISELENYTYSEIMKSRGFGKKSMNELLEIMSEYNIKFKGKN